MRLRSSPRFAFSFLALAALAAAAPQAARAGTDPDGYEHDAALDSLAARLKDFLGRTCPGATVGFEEGDLVARDQTQVFQVHGMKRYGEFDPKPHPERGPNYRGFQLMLNLHDGPVVSATVIPQDLRRNYWTTFVDAAILPGTERYAWINLDYGSRTDPKLIGQIKAEVAAWAAGQGKPGKGRENP